MIPRVAKTGTSFHGAWLYYAHDKGAMTADRVAWSHLENLQGCDVPRAGISRMIDTAELNTHCTKPVYAFSLSYPIGDQPEQGKAIEDARAALKELGMEDHQAVFFAHKDTEHFHVHIIANRIHPETLIAKNNFRDFKRLSDWALQYEREHGVVHCFERERRAKERDLNQGKNLQRYADNVILQAWEKSDGGKAFQAALEARGWKLGRGDRKDRFLALSPSGRPYDILREINKTRQKGESLKLADIEKRFSDLKREELKRIADLQKEQDAEREDAKRREEFKKQGDREAKKAFHAAADEERRRIERLHRELRLQHTEQQRIHQEAATRQRQEAQQEIKDTYALPEQVKTLKALQQRQNAKATLWGKISGKHEREQQAIKEQIKQQRRQIEEAQRLAALHEKHIEDLIRADADDLARKQAIERHKLPPIPPDRSKGKEQEQQRPQFERSRERGQGLDFDR